MNSSRHLSSLNRHLLAARYLPLRKPRLLLRLLLWYGRTFATQHQPLRYVDLNIGPACNLSCCHCFEKRLRLDGPALGLSDYRRIGRECKALGAIHLSLQGGEPTIQPNLYQIIDAIGPWDVLFSLTTNGTTLDLNLCQTLRNSGVDLLNISVDSFDADEHDRFRRRIGAYRATMNGIDAAHVSGLKVQINTCVGSFNLHTRGFRNLVEWTKARRYIHNLVLAAPAGNWSGERDMLLSEADGREVRKIIDANPHVRHDSDAIQLGRGCPAMREAIYIDAKGNLMSCPFIHVSHGNLRHNSLALLRRQAMTHYARRSPICLAAEDREFIAKRLSKTFGRSDLPLPAKEVFDRD